MRIPNPMARASLLLILSCFAVAVPLSAQEKPSATQAPAPATPPPAANPADVKSADAIMAAIYDVISGPAGKQRDWNRFRSLFVPGARLIPVVEKKGEPLTTRVISPDEYAQLADGYFQKNGFTEREAARHSEKYANIMEIFSTYESRHDAADPQPFARGINSFQLFFDGSRWWIVTIYWQEETPENPLPKEYLPAAH
jgi:hypothetical protein